MTIVSGNEPGRGPPARTMPFIARSVAATRQGLGATAAPAVALGFAPDLRPGARRQRLLAWGRVPSVHLALLIDRRQSALVVRDDQDVLQLVQIDGRLEVSRLDDRVGVAPDVDDLADQQPLGVRRTDAAAELDSGRDHLVADLGPFRRVDVLHDQDAAELADTSPVAARSDLADHRRARVVHQPDAGEVAGRPSVTRPASAPPAAITTSPDGDALVRPGQS